MARVISVFLPMWPIDRLRRQAGDAAPPAELPLVLAGRNLDETVALCRVLVLSIVVVMLFVIPARLRRGAVTNPYVAEL